MTRGPLLYFLSSLAIAAHAQTPSTLDAVVETKRFHVEGEGEQVDVHIAVLGGTATWLTVPPDKRQPHVEALTIIERDSVIVDYRKSDVLGPERNDTLTSDFLIEEHFMLPAGSYTLTVELTDVHGPSGNRSQWRGPLVLPVPPSGVSFSDLMLTNGFRTDAQGQVHPAPFTGSYYPTSVERLGFYTEIYGTDATFGKDSLFSLTYQLETYETRTVKGEFKRTIRSKGARMVPVAAEIPIQDLPSGNYLLAVEVADR
ncbi:MAG: hypothetical protein JNM91_14550, partial [Flavobacteriales bacterium]|nr:hypothetical protein [Flavobacteriales bacterium]